MAFVYIIIEEGGEETGPCKIGYSVAPKDRITALNAGNWRQLIIFEQFGFEHKGGQHVEEHLHEILSDRILRREWFDIKPSEAAAIVRKIHEREWIPDPEFKRSFHGKFRVYQRA